MCSLLYICTHHQMSSFLGGVAFFVIIMAGIGFGCLWVYFEAKAKGPAVDVDHIDKIIEDARRRANQRGRDDT